MRGLVSSGLIVLMAATACSSQADPQPPPSVSQSATPQAPTTPPTVNQARVIATGLKSPWGLAFLPDGSALVTLRDSGLIERVVPSATASAQVTTVGQVPGVNHQAGGENGLLGIAVEPGPDPKAAYVYYSTAAENRIASMSWDGSRLGPPQTILSGIPAGPFHDGGRMVFGPDGYLYVGTGDARDSASAQRRSSLGGKILRITTSGAAAPGNPFGDSPVWTLGHRNIQGLAFDAQQRLWASEFGEKTHDELNLITKGANYGWPKYEGKGNDPAYADPYVQWPTEEASPSGLAIIGDWAYMAALRGKRLWQVGIANPTPVGPFDLFVGKYGRLRTPAVAPDGSLWIVTSNTDGRANPSPGDDRIVAFTVT